MNDTSEISGGDLFLFFQKQSVCVYSVQVGNKHLHYYSVHHSSPKGLEGNMVRDDE